jgi:hypothetical protein
MSDDQATLSTPQTSSAPLTEKSDTKPAVVKVECPTPEMVKISYSPSADESAMTSIAIQTLREICSKACIGSVTISSTARTATDQARVVYENLKLPDGVKEGKSLYGANGKKVIAVYEESVKNKLGADETKKAMLDKINELGPNNVSHHIVSDDSKICVFDVAPSSIKDAAKPRFIKEATEHTSVVKFFQPPADKAYHLEVNN